VLSALPRARRAAPRRRGARGRLRDAERQLPDLIDAVLAGVLAGDGLARAVLRAANLSEEPLCTALAEARRRLGLNVPLPASLAALPPTPSFALLRGALVLVHETGGEARWPLRSLAWSLRAREELAADFRSLSAGARAQARVIAAMPPALLGVGLLTDPGGTWAVLASPAGLAVVAAGGGLDLVGFAVMRHLVQRAG